MVVICVWVYFRLQYSVCVCVCRYMRSVQLLYLYCTVYRYLNVGLVRMQVLYVFVCTFVQMCVHACMYAQAF